jgi:hypothetical protein
MSFQDDLTVFTHEHAGNKGVIYGGNFREKQGG